MALADPAARYRDYAANCVVIAQMLADVAGKLSLIDMAQAWITLAEQAEKYDSLFGVHENWAEPDRPLRRRISQGTRPSSSARPNRSRLDDTGR
jgi:hypothetical protein